MSDKTHNPMGRVHDLAGDQLSRPPQSSPKKGWDRVVSALGGSPSTLGGSPHQQRRVGWSDVLARASSPDDDGAGTGIPIPRRLTYDGDTTPIHRHRPIHDIALEATRTDLETPRSPGNMDQAWSTVKGAASGALKVGSGALKVGGDAARYVASGAKSGMTRLTQSKPLADAQLQAQADITKHGQQVYKNFKAKTEAQVRQANTESKKLENTLNKVDGKSANLLSLLSSIETGEALTRKIKDKAATFANEAVQSKMDFLRMEMTEESNAFKDQLSTTARKIATTEFNKEKSGLLQKLQADITAQITATETVYQEFAEEIENLSRTNLDQTLQEIAREKGVAITKIEQATRNALDELEVLKSQGIPSSDKLKELELQIQDIGIQNTLQKQQNNTKIQQIEAKIEKNHREQIEKVSESRKQAIDNAIREALSKQTSDTGTRDEITQLLADVQELKTINAEQGSGSDVPTVEATLELIVAALKESNADLERRLKRRPKPRLITH